MNKVRFQWSPKQALRLSSLLLIALVTLSYWPREASGETYTPGPKVNKSLKGFVRPFLERHCLDCHGETEPEGNLSLHDLGPVDEVNAGTWRSVWAQVTLKEMPPRDAEQPEVVQRLQFSDWIVGELTRVMRDKGGFHDHLDPNKGNFVDHDLLFGPLPDGIKLVPTSSPARIWRVTPQEHITRLNELINSEPEFDPAKPGLRTRGDVVPTNHGGELKLYFGTDRIIQWQGGTVAYATSVKSVPAVLSSARNHGLENYPDFYTVNSAEATQIMDVADDIIRYMAEGPLSIAEPYQITDDPKSIADKMEGDLRGLPTALVYSTKVVRPLTPVYDLMSEEGVTDERLRAAVDYLFEALTFRPPSQSESDAILGDRQTIDRQTRQGRRCRPRPVVHLPRSRRAVPTGTCRERNTGSAWSRHAPGLGTWSGRQSRAALHQAGRTAAAGNRRRTHANQGRCSARSRTHAGRRQHPKAAYPAFLPRLL